MSLSPALYLILGGLLMPLVGARARHALLLGTPLLSLYLLLTTPLGEYGQIALLDYTLTTFRLDGLSRVWGIIFSIAAFLGGLYAIHIRDRGQDAAALIYAGAGIGAVLAGDLISLFIFWELTALSSVFLIWGNRDNPRALGAGQRYLTIHIISGVLVLLGAIWRASDTGSIAFTHLGHDIFANIPGHLGPRVISLINTMTKAHETEIVIGILGSFNHRVDVAAAVMNLLEHFHNLLIGPAVQRSPEGANACRDGCVHVGTGAANQTHNRCGSVLFVISVYDQQLVHRLDVYRINLVTGDR